MHDDVFLQLDRWIDNPLAHLGGRGLIAEAGGDGSLGFLNFGPRGIAVVAGVIAPLIVTQTLKLIRTHAHHGNQTVGRNHELHRAPHLMAKQVWRSLPSAAKNLALPHRNRVAESRLPMLAREPAR